jgi:hypothetical protein
MKPRQQEVDPLAGIVAEFERRTGKKVAEVSKVIADEMTFRQWCEKLAAEGLKVDGRPFMLSNRPAMAWLYDLIPSTRADAFRRTLVLMKCAQVGFTIMEMLATIYLGVKFQPATVGMFLPDQNLANVKSTERFMPILRTVPEAYALMTQEAADGSGRKHGEGNVRTRRIGDSLFIFSWTSGRATTESIPMDILSYDEVQEMTLEQMEKTRERLSASSIRYNIMGSTANWPDADIHHWFKQGTQHRFHTECPTCGKKRPLDDYFPDCIRWDAEATDELTGKPGAYRYVCPDGHWIGDPQRGVWIADVPDAWIVSAHFPQMLSPTVSPGEIMNKYLTSTDKKNFFNRVLGKPYLDPTQIPVTLEHMARCVEAGRAADVKWKKSAKVTFMGIDQMGNFNVCVIKERMPDGRQAVIHLEEIYSDDPFKRCDELMQIYGVAVCVVEINPNYNDAKRFANRHRGKVFICNSFGSLLEDMVRWGDTPNPDISDRRTDEDERDRFTVRIDQFKCMQTSMARFTAKEPVCLFPDPQELAQEVLEKGVRMMAAVAPRAFHHFTKTALVAEKDAETNQYKRVVKKVGIDPHFSYANLLCDVAWARAHGTATFLLPAPKEPKQLELREKLEKRMPGLPKGVLDMVETKPAGEICGNCEGYDPERGDYCKERQMLVRAKDPGCWMFVATSAQ